MYIPMQHCLQAARTNFNGVIHIGAHHGEEGKDYAAAGIPNVIWVEANPVMMKHLFDNTKALPNKNYYFNSVISDIDGEEVTLNIANNGQSSSILELGTHATMYPHIQYTNKVSLKAKTFKTLFEENASKFANQKYDFLNIDVQGAELKVLKGFGDLLNNIKAIYTEINFEEVYKGCCLVGDLDEYLAKFGFVRVLTAAPEKTWGDALYLKKNT